VNKLTVVVIIVVVAFVVIAVGSLFVFSAIMGD
jgi:hypothetical protein